MNSMTPEENLSAIRHRSVEEATALLSDVAEELGILRYNSSDWGVDYLLAHMIDPTAALPSFMMRMDVESTILTGQPFWNALYSMDEETLFGVYVRDQESPEISGDVPMFLARALCRNALLSSLRIDHEHKQFTVLPFPVYYLFNATGEDGEDFPLPPDSIIFPVEFNSISLTYSRELSMKSAPDMKLSMAGD